MSTAEWRVILVVPIAYVGFVIVTAWAFYSYHFRRFKEIERRIEKLEELVERAKEEAKNEV